MAREYIEREDLLNTGREKLNRSIDKSYDAEETSVQALKDANDLGNQAISDANKLGNEAKQISIEKGNESISIAKENEKVANEANLIAKDTNDRMNQIIGGTTDNAEIIDARKPLGKDPYTTIGERMNDADIITENIKYESLKLSQGISVINENIILLENQPIKAPENTSTWISRVINEMKSGSIFSKSNKTYYLANPVTINNTDINIFFSGSSFASQGNLECLFDLHDCFNLSFFNLNVAKSERDSGDLFRITNSSFITVNNIFGTTTGFDNLFLLKGVTNSIFNNILISNSNNTKKGNGFVFHYCVNVTVNNPILRYFNYPLLLCNTKDPVNGHMNEGITINTPITLMSKTGLYVEFCTHLVVNNPILDFNSEFGVFLNSGTTAIIDNYWLGLQSGASVGVHNDNMTNAIVTNGTIAGEWELKDKQVAFKVAHDLVMNVDNVHMININGGNLNYPSINVSGDSYTHSGQKIITKKRKSGFMCRFQGIRSVDAPLSYPDSYIEVYSYNSLDSSIWLKSSGYVNKNGITHFNKIGGTSPAKHKSWSEDKRELSFEEGVDVSYYVTSVIVFFRDTQIVTRPA